MATTPTTEPASITAGDTLTWTKTLPDYPAGTYTLKYRLVNAAGKIDITATASGTDHLVSVASTTTVNYTAGDYDYQAWVEKTGERYTVGRGRITVMPNLAAQTTYDARSDARKIYEALILAYKTAVTNQAFVSEYEISGRRMRFNSKTDWIKEINFWKSQIAQEDKAARIAAGLGGNAKLLVRF